MREEQKVLKEIEDLVDCIQAIGEDLRSCTNGLEETVQQVGPESLTSNMEHITS